MHVPTDSLDRDFLRFQRTRDPDALAAVFDAAAPRLLLVAMHLCRDAAAAEDLVQTVFLQALRDVDRFDARRPVMPWLLAILEHRASDLRGRAHRRREQAGPGTAIDEAVGHAPSPEREAIAAEVRQRLAEALAGMPRDYRDVLTLRLVHGLAAVEIAHAQGLPPATVRTRLRRGLELLRSALPRGLATPGLLALLGAELLRARDGLAAVRAQVLAAATAGTGVASGIGFWGMLAACVLLVCGGWQWWRSSEPTAPAAGLPTSPGTPSAMGDHGESPPDAGARQVAERLAVAAGSAPDVRRATFAGRVVDASSGLPLPGVRVRVRAFVDGPRGDAPPDWRDPEPVLSDAEGRFALGFVPASTMCVEVHFEAIAHVQQWRSFEPPREGVHIGLGDIAMQPGTPVRLRLLAAGQPLGGIAGNAACAVDGVKPNSMAAFGPSDRDGVLDLGVCAPGTWYYDLRTAHGGHEGRVDVPLQQSGFESVITLHEPARELSISGVLVDTNGVLMPGVELGIRATRYGYHIATTRLDGRFLWAMAALSSEQPVRIELWGDRPELEWVHDGGEIAWGTHDLQLVVCRRPPAKLRLEVVAAETGQPVESFGAVCWRDPWAPGSHAQPDFKRGAIASRPGGAAAFGDLAPGAWFVSVFPPAPWAERAEMPIVLEQGASRTLRVELVRPAALVVDVTDASTGAALPGIDVALAKVVPADRHHLVEVGSFRAELEHARRGYSYSTAQNTLVMARATSDANGKATLHAPPDLPGLVLFAEGPRCVATLRRDVELPRSGASTSITVVPAAQVHGVLGPRAFVQRCGPPPAVLAAAEANARTQWPAPGAFAEDRPRVELRAVDTPTRFGTHVAADGSFVFGGMPAGRYEVWVQAAVRDDDGRRAWAADLGPLTTLDLRAGATTGSLQLDASQFVPARATLQFFVDGAPWQGAVGLVVPGEGIRVLLKTSMAGTVVSPWLRPGPYVPFVCGVDANGDRQVIVGSDRFVVEPGRDLQTTCTLQRRRVEIALRDAQGHPLRDRWLRVEPLDAPEVAHLRPQRTDAEGRIVLDPAPPGRLRVRAFAADWRQGSEDPPAHDLGEVEALATRAVFVLHATKH